EMTTIFYTEPELVLAQGRKVLFLNPNDLQIFKDIELPTDLTTCGLKIAKEAEPTEENNADGKAAAPAPAANPEVSIVNVSYSPDRQLIAVTTAGQKALLLYKSRPEHAQLLSVRPLERASSAIRFASDSSSLLVTDKTGECYQYDCVQAQAAPRLLFGHLSIVYDILWTPDQRHIITCDRDDKIRVTNYPATYDIHSYCLGHKEFVAGLALLGGEHIVSVSGDKTLRVWNYMSGKELLQHTLPAPAVRLQLRELQPGQRYQVAVLFYDHSEALGLYDLALQDNTSECQWHVAREQLIRADAGAWNISNFVLTEERVYVAGALDERLQLRVYKASDGTPDSTVPAGWLDMVEEAFGDQACVPEDLSVWFKKRYDNVSDYMERKKRRIEDHHQQQKC
ncbi:hypothetical protein KR222_004131, partial [Zaprionus bogoriensis]